MIIIPTIEGLAHYTQRGIVLLEGQAYNITLRWNARDQVIEDDGTITVEGAWYMDVNDADDVPIAIGLKLALGVYIGRQSTDELFLQGAFVLVDTTNKGREPGFDDIAPGGRCVLSYWTHLELFADMVARLDGGSIDSGAL